MFNILSPQTEPERSERRFSASDGRLRRQENDTLLVSDFESDEYYYYYDDNGLGRGKKKKKKTQEIFYIMKITLTKVSQIIQ